MHFTTVAILFAYHFLSPQPRNVVNSILDRSARRKEEAIRRVSQCVAGYFSQPEYIMHKGNESPAESAVDTTTSPPFILCIATAIVSHGVEQ